MPESFGVRLRQQRERQHIALATIAEQTKIQLSLLEGLERDNVAHWPTGIFRRAFIRAYAHAIDLDQEAVVREFLEVHPDPGDVVETVSPGAPDANARSVNASPPTRLQYLVAAVIGSLSGSRHGTGAKLRSTSVDVPAADGPAEPPPPAADLRAIARLCTEFGRLDECGPAAPMLQEVAGILGAVGLMVWAWDPAIAELRPLLAHGYSDRVLAQLPRVRREADNATAAAFRSAQPCVVRGSDRARGALVVPLLTPAGCVGVLAIELTDGREQRPAVGALATIVAAQLARVVEHMRSAEASNRRLA